MTALLHSIACGLTPIKTPLECPTDRFVFSKGYVPNPQLEGDYRAAETDLTRISKLTDSGPHTLIEHSALFQSVMRCLPDTIEKKMSSIGIKNWNKLEVTPSQATFLLDILHTFQEGLVYKTTTAIPGIPPRPLVKNYFIDTRTGGVYRAFQRSTLLISFLISHFLIPTRLVISTLYTAIQVGSAAIHMLYQTFCDVYPKIHTDRVSQVVVDSSNKNGKAFFSRLETLFKRFFTSLRCACALECIAIKGILSLYSEPHLCHTQITFAEIEKSWNEGAAYKTTPLFQIKKGWANLCKCNTVEQMGEVSLALTDTKPALFIFAKMQRQADTNPSIHEIYKEKFPTFEGLLEGDRKMALKYAQVQV